MRQRRPWSLRGRLLAIAAAAGVMAWLAGGAAIYSIVQRQHAELFDARLADIARTLMAFADHEIDEVRSEGGSVPTHFEPEGDTGARYRYQIWTREGELLLSSWNAPVDLPMMPLAQPGLATREVRGEPMRVVNLPAPSGRLLILAAEPLAQRLDAGDVFGGRLGAWILLSAAAVAGCTLLLARLALRPLNAAAQQIGQRGPGDLSPVQPAHLPAEFTPLVDATNRLMQRLDVALRSEREFVAAAAHELRTPLAGLQAQAQLAAHRRTGEAERLQALRAVQEGVDQSAHLVNQLLDLARSDALAGDPVRLAERRCRVELRAVLERVLGELGPQIAERGQHLVQRLDAATVEGSDFGLGLILRNLLANASAHAPEGGTVELGSRIAAGGGLVLWVADSGPGMAPAERARAFERFYRAKGSTHAGVGLGLSIVKAMADAHGAAVSLGESALGGLLVEVGFPPPSA